MYLEYWKLKHKPFSNTPDPIFYYHSRQHEEALAKLYYVVSENNGAGLLTGTYGCGKTMISRLLLSHIASVSNPFVCNAMPDMSTVDLLRTIARIMGYTSIAVNKSELVVDALMEAIENAVISHSTSGKQVVLFVDEAHLITSHITWETLRLLMNLHNNDSFLLTLIISGHPELERQVNEIPQLAQRIAVRCMLGPFDQIDTAGYIKKRLSVAGSERPIFRDDAINVVYQLSGGVPRKINTICSSALAVGANTQREDIDAATVIDAVKKFAIV